MISRFVAILSRDVMQQQEPLIAVQWRRLSELRELAICAAIQMAAGGFFPNASPLLEKEGNAGLVAVIPEATHPCS